MFFHNFISYDCHLFLKKLAPHKEKPTSYLIYLDITNLYEKAMSEFQLRGDFRWFTEDRKFQMSQVKASFWGWTWSIRNNNMTYLMMSLCPLILHYQTESIQN